jgi:hypothetical protein
VSLAIWTASRELEHADDFTIQGEQWTSGISRLNRHLLDISGSSSSPVIELMYPLLNFGSALGCWVWIPQNEDGFA